MKGVFFIGILLALLIAGYLTYQRIENPKGAEESKDLLDMPNMAKEKAEKWMEKTQERYDEAMDEAQ